jgi:hypothetical protein
MIRALGSAWKHPAFAGIAGAGLALLAGAAPARAHDQPYSYLDVRVDSTGLHGRIAAHIVDLARAIHDPTPDSLLRADVVSRLAPALRGALVARMGLTADGRAVHATLGDFEILPDRKLVAFAWRAPGLSAPGWIRDAGPLFAEDPQHETFVNVYLSGRIVHQDVLDHDHTTSDWYAGGRQVVWAVVREFVAQGIHHIFIGPDHILFIVGLLLLGGGIGRVLTIVTGFTLAHSVTLALAALGIVQPPARIIEPLIAFSIVCVGVENLLARRSGRDLRPWLAFGFGFVHGFGFASVLKSFGLPTQALAWSLVSFNVGVEIGQATIVLAVSPVLALLRARAPQHAGRVVVVGSAGVIAAGAFWFVQRVLGGS